MLWTIFSVILGLLAFGLLVLVHELGHFSAAKAVGIKVHEFAIGMGPRVLGFVKGETKYSLRLFPIGGYVKMEGEDEESQDARSFSAKPPWARFFVIAAGAIVNLIFGFLVFLLMTTIAGSIVTTSIGEVQQNTPAQAAGWQKGDTIYSVDGSRVQTYMDLQFRMSKAKLGDVLSVVIIRNGQKQSYQIAPKELVEEVSVAQQRPGEPTTRTRLIFGFTPQIVPVTIKNALPEAANQTMFMSKYIILSLFDLVTGKVAVSQMSGPVGVVSEISRSSQSLLSMLGLVGAITVNLGIFNLMPLPALDGGRLMFIVLEMIRRKPVNPKKEGYVHFVGLMLLFAMIIFVTYGDIVKLIKV